MGGTKALGGSLDSIDSPDVYSYRFNLLVLRPLNTIFLPLRLCALVLIWTHSVLAESDNEACEDLACDREVLVALYNATDGANWSNSENWLSDESVFEWHGIEPSADGRRVGSIFLRSNGLTGRLSAELGKLAALVDLELGANDISGKIPIELGQLSRLQLLDLRFNDLTGSVPPALGSLSNLYSLFLIGNRLNGEIPVEFLKLNLSNFGWSHNPDLCMPDTEEFAAWIEGIRNHRGGLFCGADDPLAREVLIALYNATDGGNWVNNENWLSDESVFKWHGVGPSADGRRVGSISLRSNGLTGRLPAELGKLAVLAHLELSENDISGKIPIELGQLSRLQSLDLSFNDLTGKVPPALGSLSSLQSLFLVGNQLNGEIPVEFLELKLGFFWWSENPDLCMPDTEEFAAWIESIRNHRGGPFCGTDDPLAREVLVALYNATDGENWVNNENWVSDESVFKWHGVGPSADGSRVASISLSSNGLTGRLPAELGKLAALVHLELGSNDISGTIPIELGQLSSLQSLDLSFNDLTGNVPPALGSLSSLQRLFLVGNRLNGEIPVEFLELKLGLFRWSGNPDLCMPDTEEFAAWVESITSYSGGYFCGGGNPIDREALVAFYNATDGENWVNNENWLSDDSVFKWHGIGPSDDGRRVASISLGSNGLTGRLPAELGRLEALVHLELRENDISGTIPIELGQLSRLQSLDLRFNDLTGNVPPALGSLSNLQSLFLVGNRLNGELPVEFLELKLNLFWWSENPDLCMPDTEEFATWIESIANYIGGYFCGGANPIDREALVALYNATDGGNWVNDENWLSDDSVFKWHGIGPSADGRRVASISLGSNGLTGRLPAELGKLEALVHLELRENDISGSIPIELGQLSRLQSLDLRFNDLTGNVPPALGSLSNLHSLFLVGNRLNGEIPVEFLELKLGLFWWSENPDLCMPDTEEFAAWIESIREYSGGPFCGADDLLAREVLVALYNATDGGNWVNSENWLSDESVFEWHGIGPTADGRQVGSISLRSNGLTGLLPAELGKLAALVNLELSGNDISGTIPAELGQLSRLQWLDLSLNDLTGNVPSALGSLSSLHSLFLIGNRLNGEIPVEFLKLNLSDFGWSRNPDLCMPDTKEFAAWIESIRNHRGGPFCGADDPLAREVLVALYNATEGSNWTNNENWLSDESVFEWHGIGPSADGRRVASISLRSNGLTGRLPAELGKLAALVDLELSGNDISGKIPIELGQLSRLQSLDLSFNDLTGNVPSALGSLSSLYSLFLVGNRLNGEIPVEFLELELGHFWWSDNPDLCMPDTEEFAAWIESIREYSGGPFCGADDLLAREVLVALYNATDGGNWINNENWLSDESVFKWHGVGPSADGRRVGSISLRSNGLTGRLPAELGKLAALVHLELGENDISGKIPGELGQLSRLQLLELSFNDLTGNVPPALGSLSSLQSLSWVGNRLNGEIPVEFLKLNLSNFGWSDNPDLCMPDTEEFAIWIDSIRNYRGGPFCGADDPLAREVLVALYHATDGGNWINNENWLSNESVFKWHGIGPSADGRRVGSISLRSNGLTGRLPAELRQLSELAELYLSWNDISGELPSELGQLQKLQALDLGGNDLNGHIPSELGSLTQMSHLNLQYNDLTGVIPKELMHLNLSVFYWSGNRDLCMPETPEFRAWHDQITITSGEFCGERDQAVLDMLYEKTGGPEWIHSTGWIGGISRDRYGIETNAADRVITIDLVENGLAGELPSTIGDLKHLMTLRLDGNSELSGRLPYTLVQLENLEELSYSATSLCVPTESDVRDWLDKLPAHAVTVKDCEPQEDRKSLIAVFDQMNGSNWRKKENWDSDVSLGMWHGVETDGQGRVTKLTLNDTNLKGTIPRELFDLVHLKSLVLIGPSSRSPEIDGVIPDAIGNLTQLTSLKILKARITGPIPATIGKLTNLQSVVLSGTALTGELPRQLGELKNLESLDMADNKLFGSIPIELANLTELQSLIFSKNDLSGPIPSVLGHMANLSSISLNSNSLSGEIPREIGESDRIEFLNLSNNDLSGTLPPELGNLASSLSYLNLINNKLEGELPVEYAKLRNLQALFLTGNAKLSGQLPKEYVALTNLRDLQAVGTDICVPNSEQILDWLSSAPYSRVRSCGHKSQPAYLVQSVQSRDIPIALLADESAALRVFPTAVRSNDEDLPAIRTSVYHGNEIVHSLETAGKNGPIPLEVDESSLEQSLIQMFPGNFIKPDLEIVIELDPNNTISEGLLTTKRIPEEGRMKVEVKEAPVFNLTLIPFLWQDNPDMSVIETVTEMAAGPDDHPLFGMTRTMLPIVDMNVTTHTPIYSTSNNLNDILIDVNLIHTMEDGNGYYMGIMSGEISGFAGGVASVAGYTASSIPDEFIIAHELGHNLSMRHAPCGSPARVDPAYPYLGGTTGVWGYKTDGNQLVSPNTHYDLMSYCGPPWISDYSFHKMTRHRIHYERKDDASPLASLAKEPTLILWGGKAGNQELYLEPVLIAQARPKFPEEPGPYTVTGLDSDGKHLFAVSFHMQEFLDVEGGVSYGFTFALPIKPGWRDQLSDVSLSSRSGSVSILESNRPSITIFRDAYSGQIRGIGRGDEADKVARVLQNDPNWRYPEEIFSNGVPDLEAWFKR